MTSPSPAPVRATRRSPSCRRRLAPTDIPWADYRWNPIAGCSPASPGCAHCYAAAIAHRFKRPWGSPVFHPERLAEPANTKRPGRVFCGSVTDLGHPGVQPEWRDAIADAMLAAPWHTYIVSTKRPGPWLHQLPQFCWLLVSIESQDHTDRWPILCHWTAGRNPVLGISAEPLLGALHFPPSWRRPDWLIAGPETGPGARPCDPAWHAALEAWARSIPFFDKRPQPTRREYPAPALPAPLVAILEHRHPAPAAAHRLLIQDPARFV
jgi:protein gp37